MGGSCKTSDKIWGIVDPKTNRLYRLTFSKSLADLIVEKHRPGFKVVRLSYLIGKRLEAGQESSTGIYGLISRDKGIALRASLNKEIAALHSDSSRYISELYLSKG